jgi:hypothetical protein
VEKIYIERGSMYVPKLFIEVCGLLVPDDEQKSKVEGLPGVNFMNQLLPKFLRNIFVVGFGT